LILKQVIPQSGGKQYSILYVIIYLKLTSNHLCNVIYMYIFYNIVLKKSLVLKLLKLTVLSMPPQLTTSMDT
jgi:hypothetical protein